MLVRFLFANKFDAAATEAALRRSLSWRGQNEVDAIARSWQPTPILSTYFAAGWSGTDRDGRPLLLVRLGQFDVPGLFQCVPAPEMLKQLIWLNEIGLQKCQEATETLGRPIMGCTCVCDLDGVSLRHLWTPGFQQLQKLIQVICANYPEVLSRIYLCRAPSLFPLLWYLASKFLAQRTCQKVTLLGDAYAAALADVFADGALPDFLGGTHEAPIPKGGQLPPEVVAQGFGGQRTSLLTSDAYTAATIGRMSAFRVPHDVRVPESILAWDFTVQPGVTFGVYFSRTSADAAIAEAHCLRGPEHMDEQAPTQGSLKCTEPGFYILVWDNSSSWLHAKQLFYHTSVIADTDIRQSMISITSGDSDATPDAGSLSPLPPPSAPV